MFITICKDATSTFTSSHWYQSTDIIRLLAHAVERRRHAIFLTPSQLEAALQHCDLGTTERRVLEGTYGSRIQDFAQWYRASACRLIIDPNRNSAEIQLSADGCDVRWPAPTFKEFEVYDWSELLGEHFRNDAEWYKLLAEKLYRYLGLHGLGPALRATHGGGGGMAAYFPALRNTSTICACIVDRDSAGDWLGPGKQARECLKHVYKAKLLERPAVGVSDRRAFFAISVTSFRSVANSVPPSLLDIYFREVAPNPAALSAIKAVFPTFPKLSGDEWRLWFGFPFEQATSVGELNADFGGKLSPAVLARAEAAISTGMQPRIPKGVTGALLDWAEGSAASLKAVRHHIAEALEDDDYRSTMIASLRIACQFGAALVNPVI